MYFIHFGNGNTETNIAITIICRRHHHHHNHHLLHYQCYQLQLVTLTCRHNLIAVSYVYMHIHDMDNYVLPTVLVMTDLIANVYYTSNHTL